MKKFIIIVSSVILLYFALDYVYYYLGWYIDLRPDRDVETWTTVQNQEIMVLEDGEFTPFEIKGMDLGSAEPGQWITDYDIDQETYLRWFAQIQDLGSNTIRVYTVQNPSFYRAFYKYNTSASVPLYLLQGVGVNDYIQNSSRDAYHEDFLNDFIQNCKTAVDVIHGQKKIQMGRSAVSGSGSYNKDISPWVIGYILGIDWEGTTVIYTDKTYENDPSHRTYSGTYMRTTPEASAFEAVLARVGDTMMEYETSRYKQQRLLAFSNWPITDPFEYEELLARYNAKCAQIDVEHIECTDQVLSGQFASYHVYPYFPDFLRHMTDWSPLGITKDESYVNTYRSYLTALVKHHSIPVVISEFGIPTGRGMAQTSPSTGRNMGALSESEQGQTLIDCYNDIMAAGCAGSCVFEWQDEWNRRTWNTMYAVELNRSPYWSDYQTSGQYFGLLSFDPGEEKCVCYVDGDISEWTGNDIVLQSDDTSVSVKYDEKFVYFLIYKENLQFGTAPLYLPLDITPKTGTSYCKNYDLLFDRAADFLLVLDGTENSRLLVQERYEALRSTYARFVYKMNTYEQKNIPDSDSPSFVPVLMLLDAFNELKAGYQNAVAEVYETGALTYGNANPESADYNSLADFICSGNYVELKLPWQLLNFSDPSHMQVHDDYYDGNYGVENISINELYVGIGTGNEDGRIHLGCVPLEGWDNHVTWHERLKPAYYALQEIWTNE